MVKIIKSAYDGAKGKKIKTKHVVASLPATVRTLFGLPEALTARDKAANTFDKNLTRSTPRTDTPMTLPVPGNLNEVRRHRRLLRAHPLLEWLRGLVIFGHKSKEPLTLYQQSLVELVDRLNEETGTGLPPRAGKILHEHEAAIHVHRSLRRYMGR